MGGPSGRARVHRPISSHPLARGRLRRRHDVEDRNEASCHGLGAGVFEETRAETAKTDRRMDEEPGDHAHLAGDAGSPDDLHRLGVGLGVQGDVPDHLTVHDGDPGGERPGRGQETVEVAVGKESRIAVEDMDPRCHLDERMHVARGPRPDAHPAGARRPTNARRRSALCWRR
jgi:hypothetical protein